MKKYILAIGVAAAFGIYILFNSQKSVNVTTSVNTPAENNAGTVSSSTTGSAGPVGSTGTSMMGGGTVVPVGMGNPPMMGAYKNGSYKGSIADAYFGNVQVEAIIASGRLTDVQFLTYPNDSGHSAGISRTALPVLKQEAIQSQSASVNIVSGATQTSQAFQESLQVALTAAKN